MSFSSIKSIYISTLLVTQLFSTRITPGSGPVQRNKCRRPAALDADSSGQFLVFRNDLPVNSFCAALCVPAKCAVFFLDLDNTVGVYAVVSGQLLHDFLAQFLPECNPPASGHGIQLGGFKVGGVSSPRKQEWIPLDQSPVFVFAVLSYFP